MGRGQLDAHVLALDAKQCTDVFTFFKDPVESPEAATEGIPDLFACH